MLRRMDMFDPGIAPVDLNFTWLANLLGVHARWRFPFRGEVPYYYLGLIMVLLVYVIMRRLEDSRLGRAWLAIREDSMAAASCGNSGAATCARGRTTQP